MATTESRVKLISGTHGTLFCDGVRIAEATGFQAKIEKTKEGYTICGNMMEQHKTLGLKGTGSMEIFNVDSGMVLGETTVLAGHDKYYTLVSDLADPDAMGAQRVAVKRVNFDDITLADWKAGTVGKVTKPFTFGDYQLLDLIPAG
ncbi:MAG: phage tail tube protein [Oscillospiraceae bacterium]